MLAEMRLPFPPPLSACFTDGPKHLGRVKTKRYRAWQQHALYAAKWQPEIKGPVSVIVQATKPDRRKRDLDNLCKPLLDILVAKGVIEDDSLVESLFMKWVDGEPGVSVMVLPMPEGKT